MEMNEILEKLPKHLMSLVVDQPYDAYTARDQAVWRYVMRQNVRHLSKVAYKTYLEGLKKTGISLEKIPGMYGMNRILKDIGWAAVTVDGFIPPSAFMSFQAYNVLVIAADIRSIDQIGYTPAPDIIHEAAGHAPIIADPKYAAFLKRFGEIGSKAFLSPRDYKLYDAIRHLSIVKADPCSSKETVRQAEKQLSECSANMGDPSELAKIRSLHWWTVEYGLIGTPDNPKIYGAGLLSSIAESSGCLKPEVKKLPLTVEAASFNFDITEPQPQLFITPDFDSLSKVLEEFADTMAFRRGGIYGLAQAIRSQNTGTCVFSSGLEVSGTFTTVIEKYGQPVYIGTKGPSNLNFEGKELPGHNKQYHHEGFGSPVGEIKYLTIPLQNFSEEELGQIGLSAGEHVNLDFESGVHVAGMIKQFTFRGNHLILVSFQDCHVTWEGKTLFEPSWGIYDMAVGQKIVSVYSGPADPEAFGLSYPVPSEKTHKLSYDAKTLKLFAIYRKVREIREENCSFALLPSLWEELKKDHPADWLCALEMLELLRAKKIDDKLTSGITAFLQSRQSSDPTLTKLIADGLAMR